MINNDGFEDGISFLRKDSQSLISGAPHDQGRTSGGSMSPVSQMQESVLSA